METVVKKSLRQLLCHDRGAQIAEFAAVVPMLVMIIFGILWFGRAFNIYTTVNHAAQAAAEAAATPSCVTCGSVNTLPDRDTVKSTVVDPILIASHLDPNDADLTFNINPHQPLDPNATVFGPVVTMSYPYRFRLNGLTCCPPTLAPITMGITINARAQTQEEN
jgi:hypothetical protein